MNNTVEINKSTTPEDPHLTEGPGTATVIDKALHLTETPGATVEDTTREDAMAPRADIIDDNVC